MYTAGLLGDDGGERFYLRILLHHVRGPRSFRALRTVEVDGREHVCATFKQVPPCPRISFHVIVPHCVPFRAAG